MVDKSVNLITISEKNKLVLHNSVLENLFQNIECPIAILTVINYSENFDPHFLDLILRYFALNGKQDWDKSHYKWNSDSSQDITPGIRVWSRPLQLSGNQNESKDVNVILMENNINADVSEEIGHKLIALSIDISSNIIFNTNECLIRSSLLSIEKSLNYVSYKDDNKYLFIFIVRDWKRKKRLHGFRGGRDYYANILHDTNFNNIDKNIKKYFGEKECLLMPGSESHLSTQRRMGSTRYSSLGLMFYVNRIIERYLEYDKISTTNLNSFEIIEKIRAFIKYSESYRDAGETNNENGTIRENNIESSYKHEDEENENEKRVKIEKPIEEINFGIYFVRYGYVMDDKIEISEAFPHYEVFSGEDILIGEDTKKFAQIQPVNVIVRSKLFLGCPDLNLAKDELYPFEIHKYDGNFVEFLVDFDNKKTEFKCEKIIGQVLKEVRRNVEVLLGTKVSDCVISVPSSFTAVQRDALKSATAIAGLKVKTLFSDTVRFNWFKPPYFFLIKS